MANPELVRYLRSAIAAGKTEQQARAALLREGWTDRDIETALEHVTVPMGVPAARQAFSPRSLAAFVFSALGGLLILLNSLAFLLPGLLVTLGLLDEPLAAQFPNLPVPLPYLGAAGALFGALMVAGAAAALYGQKGGVAFVLAGSLFALFLVGGGFLFGTALGVVGTVMARKSLQQAL